MNVLRKEMPRAVNSSVRQSQVIRMNIGKNVGNQIERNDKMKKQSFIITFSVLILLIWNNVYTQEPPPQKKTQVGIGVSITDIKDLFQYIEGAGPPATEIFIPINISPTLRIEPEIGFFQSSSENENFKSSSKSFSFGLGIFRMNLKDGINLYYGARLGLTRTSSSFEYSYNGSATDEQSVEGFFIAPTVGGEYFLNNSFTLGGEAQLRYASSSGKDEDDEEMTTSTTATRALLFIRFYF